MNQVENTVQNLAKCGFDEYGGVAEEFWDASGISRAVCLDAVGGVAYKLAREYHNAEENRVEWERYHEFPEAVRDLMARPLYISDCNRVLAVEMVDCTLYDMLGKIPYNDDVRRKEIHAIHADFNNRLRGTLEDAGYTRGQIDDMMRDNHNENIGMRQDGTVLWIDWAMNHSGEYDPDAY